jgi:hypothetical protein
MAECKMNIFWYDAGYGKSFFDLEKVIRGYPFIGTNERFKNGGTIFVEGNILIDLFKKDWERLQEKLNRLSE